MAGRPRKTASEVEDLIMERAGRYAPRPKGVTIIVFATRNGWDVTIRKGFSRDEINYRTRALRIAKALQEEFDLGGSFRVP
jgi:hypothetical protein